MRIFVKHLALIPPPFGGVSVYVKRLSLTLCKKGLLSGAFYDKEIKDLPSDLFKLFDKFPAHTCSYYVLPYLPFLLHAFRKCTIIHAHTSLNTSFLIYLLHVVLRKPVVYTIHNQMIDLEFLLMSRLDKYCFRKLISSKDVQLIAVNDNTKSLLEAKLPFISRPIKVIPAFISPIETNTDSILPASLIKFIEDNDPVLFFYANDFTNYNGNEIYGETHMINLFVRLFNSNPKIKLVFCMTNVSNNDKLLSLQNIIKEHNCFDRVYWQLNPLIEMWPLWKKCFMYIRPTSTDGDSVALREALSYGVNVVASDVAKRPDGTYVYEYGNEEQLFQIAKSLLLGTIKQDARIITKDYFDDILKVYQSFSNK